LSATWRPRAGFLYGAAVVALLIANSYAASAANRHAAMVIDANTGNVLYAKHANARRYPASLTKIMTLYLALEQIDSGRLKFSSMIPISKRAHRAPPSKIGLKPGSKIALRDAIKLLITKSANDVAVAVAERIGGSERGFARMMTKRARQIGMRSTVFKNASGLPNSRQHTTAQDMLTLALRIKDDFPHHYHLFSLKSFKYRGKVYRSHNKLMRKFPGMDGMKTGYTRASGFNLVASVRTGKKHLVAAVFGGKTAKARNSHMRLILYRALKKASTRVTRSKRPRLILKKRQFAKEPGEPWRAKTKKTRVTKVKPPRKPKPAPARKKPAPAPKPAVKKQVRKQPPPQPPKLDLQALRTAMATEESDRAAASPASIEEIIGDANAARVETSPSSKAEPTVRLKRLRDEPQPAQQVSVAPPKPLRAGTQTTASLPEPKARNHANSKQTASASPQRLAATPSDAGYEIQIGAYATAKEAENRLTGAMNRAAGLLNGRTPVTQPVQKGPHQIYRARFTRFDEKSANNACRQLRRMSIDCFVMRSE
jgi:D-alanyl-D-alanine carboxypeptidase